MSIRNFSIFSRSAKNIEVQLFENERLFSRSPLSQNGSTWSSQVETGNSTSYSFLVDGNEVLDPMAKQIAAPRIWGKGSSKRAFLSDPSPFDWQETKKPQLSPSDLIIYEVHVRGFTQDASSKVSTPGTFAGMREKIPYLVDLGITAVELMPLFEFDETKGNNFWGYSSESFFAPMARFANGDPVTELKELIRELHRVGIEVILDVVYNHSDAFLQIDPQSYYIQGDFANASGCGNTLSANSEPMQSLILESLRYFATEFQIDGFRFDLASCLTRDSSGNPLTDPPLIRAIENDPALQDVKLFAEPWDPGGLYQVGSFPGKRFAEWNGHYRDVVRRFLKGTDGQLGAFASSFIGSDEIYDQPLRSVNYITAHDGFSLHDLFSYNEKHNWDNGEENRDGSDHNESWNCGAEGATEDSEIIDLRKRQMHNTAVILFCSLGIPLIVSGDEVAQTRYGNNNPWCQDNKLTHFPWQKHPFTEFIKMLIRLRKEHAIFRKNTFFHADSIHWHGIIPHQMEWSKEGRFLAVTLQDVENNEQFYFAFNAFYEDLDLTLPSSDWDLLIDTSNEKKFNKIKAHSILVLRGKIC